VCEKCEAEYKILHNMNERYYVMEYCTFCGVELSKDLEDEIEEWDEDE
jgi:predicted nucleic acid-binding Zn ribbon protein